MRPNPLKSLSDYSRFVAEVMDHPVVQRSTLAVWSEAHLLVRRKERSGFRVTSDYAYEKNFLIWPEHAACLLSIPTGRFNVE